MNDELTGVASCNSGQKYGRSEKDDVSGVAGLNCGAEDGTFEGFRTIAG